MSCTCTYMAPNLFTKKGEHDIYVCTAIPDGKHISDTSFGW